MLRHLRATCCALLVILSCLVAPDARAATPAWLSEVRLAALVHDFQFFDRRVEPGAALGAELLFRSPAWLGWAFAPRPHLGVLLHSEGVTHQLYGGLTWQHDFAAGPFLAASFGLSVHSGERVSDRPDRADLGSNLLFRSAVEAGWRFDRHGLSLLFSHISHAKLFDDHNPGMNHFGLRYGYRF